MVEKIHSHLADLVLLLHQSFVQILLVAAVQLVLSVLFLCKLK